MLHPGKSMQHRSLYVDLLSVSIRARNQSDHEPSLGEALAELERCRRHIASTGPPDQERGWSTRALADQVAYDVALIQCAQCAGIDCYPDRFGWPKDERTRLERCFATRGIPLD